jgi:hypothetical protein
MARSDQPFVNAVRGKQSAVLNSVSSCLGKHRYIILLSLLICGVGYWGLHKDIVGMYHDKYTLPLVPLLLLFIFRGIYML